METVEVSDLYEASYLLLNKCELAGVECVQLGGATSCRFLFEDGAETSRLQREFRSREATVNLDKFRTAYNTINGYMHQAKKSRDMELRRTRREGRGSGELSGYVDKSGWQP